VPVRPAPGCHERQQGLTPAGCFGRRTVGHARRHGCLAEACGGAALLSQGAETAPRNLTRGRSASRTISRLVARHIEGRRGVSLRRSRADGLRRRVLLRGLLGPLAPLRPWTHGAHSRATHYSHAWRWSYSVWGYLFTQSKIVPLILSQRHPPTVGGTGVALSKPHEDPAGFPGYAGRRQGKRWDNNNARAEQAYPLHNHKESHHERSRPANNSRAAPSGR
jgi:hypothetical protein